MSLGKKVFSSALLLLLRKISGNLINLGVMAYLARILSREDFGLLAISSVFLGIINTLATSGIADYLVYYDKEDRQLKINAAFWLNLFLTLAVVVIIVIGGPVWADFYDNDLIYPLMLLLAIPFFFEMGSTVPKSILRKELDYKVIVLNSGIAMTVISIGKVISAWYGLGVYSLVVPQAIVSPFLMFSFFYKTKWIPYFTIGFKHFKDIFNYTKHIVGGRVLTRLVNDGDNLIVGKFIGMEGLGIYALAFQLANLVTSNILFLVNDIFLPLFSKIKGDVAQLKLIYSRMIQFLSFISFPLITVLIIAADPIVYFIYGNKWMDAVIPFQMLCVFALGRSLSSPSSSLFNAVGRPDIGFKFTLFFTPVFLLFVFFGSKFGVIGVALSTTVIRVVGSFVSLYISLSLIQLKLSDLYRLVKSNLAATAFVLLLFSWSIVFSFENEKWVVIFITPMILYMHILIQRLLFYSQVSLFFETFSKYIKYRPLETLFKIIFFLKT